MYKGGKVDYFPYMDEISTVCITASLVAMLMASLAATFFCSLHRLSIWLVMEVSGSSRSVLGVPVVIGSAPLQSHPQ